MILNNTELINILDERRIGYYWVDGRIAIRKNKITFAFLNYLILLHSYISVEVRPEEYVISLVEVDHYE